MRLSLLAVLMSSAAVMAQFKPEIERGNRNANTAAWRCDFSDGEIRQSRHGTIDG